MAFRIIRKRKEARRLAKIEEIFQVIKCNYIEWKYKILDFFIRRKGTKGTDQKLDLIKFMISTEFIRYDRTFQNILSSTNQEA